MKNKDLALKKCILHIENFLETEISYFEITKQTETKAIVEANFSNSKFSKGKKYHFPYSNASAIAIIDSCQYYTNSFELLLNTYFTDDLNWHSSIHSLEDEVQEVALEWRYGGFVYFRKF